MPFTLAPTDAAYLAGLIDGEGYVSGEGQPIIQIVSTTPEITDWLLATVPVGRLEPRGAITTAGKPIHRWTIGSRHACARVAEQVLPYMRIEKKVARLAEFTGLVYS